MAHEKKTAYLDNKGNRYFVDHGIGGPLSSWMTITHKADQDWGGHRVKSPALPLRPTREEAQADLDAYAARKGFVAEPAEAVQ